jgi:hypothetical protein
VDLRVLFRLHVTLGFLEQGKPSPTLGGIRQAPRISEEFFSRLDLCQPMPTTMAGEQSAAHHNALFTF